MMSTYCEHIECLCGWVCVQVACMHNTRPHPPHRPIRVRANNLIGLDQDSRQKYTHMFGVNVSFLYII
jgi:hypothetical protein